jgi:hypothetical protein
MKQASLVLAAATAGSLGVQAFTVPYTTVVANTAGDVPEIVGETAYLGGSDGVLAAPVKGTAAVKIYYEFVDPGTKVRAIMTWTSLEFLTLVNPKTVALSPGDTTSTNLFVTTYSANNAGTVSFFQGEYSSWSVQQTLSPPDHVDIPRNQFGSVLQFDRENFETLYVACGNCSTSAGKGRGAIYLYEQDKGPKKHSWSQTSVITHSKLYGLGMSKLSVNKDLLVASTTSNGPILFRKVKGEYTPEQILGDKQTVLNFQVYHDTIALSVAPGSHGGHSLMSSVLILGSAKPAPAKEGPLKGKQMPIQWSVQQVLVPPLPSSSPRDHGFGTGLSFDGDRLAIISGNSTGAAVVEDLYVYERSSSTGKWSVQQSLQDFSGKSGKIPDIYLRGSDLLVVKNASRITFWDQFANSDCLIVQVEDHFGDGWDVARLTATAPDGSKEYYSSRCDLGNPHKVRYCPAKLEMGGIYHFEVINAAGKAKNFWELQWRVYDEKSAKWYIGGHDTKMDFEWSPEAQTFTPRHMHHPILNESCTYCPPRPTDKPTPVLRSRALKGGDDKNNKWSTQHPTSTPAPTLATTNNVNWRSMILHGSDLWWSNVHKTASYYVSDAKSQRLVATGTLCPGEASGKVCWVDLPDGEYNVRVGGALGATAITWQFCRSAEQIASQTQISIRIQDGECTALSRHPVASYCLKTNAQAVVQIEFIVLGVSHGSLGADDTDALRNAIAFAFNGLTKDDVQISAASSGADGLYVSADVTLSQKQGYDVLSVDGLDQVMSSVETYMAGNGPRAIWSGLQSAEHRTVFATSTSVQFISAELTGSKDEILDTTTAVDEVLSYFDQPSSSYEEKNSGSSDANVLDSVSTAGYFLAAGALVALVAGLVVVSRRASAPVDAASTKDYSELEAASTHSASSRVQLKDLNYATPNVADLKQLVESEDEVLKIMLSRGK